MDSVSVDNTHESHPVATVLNSSEREKDSKKEKKFWDF